MFFSYIDPGTGFTVVTAGGWLIAVLLGSLGAVSFFFKRIFKFLKKPKTIFIIILILIISSLITAGVLMNKKASKFNQKVVILGFDGMSPEILEPMLAEGKLPNFARLKAQGSYSRLATTNPSQSPVAWAGFATGQNPGKNGIFDFIVRDPKNLNLSLSLSNIENGKAHRVLKSKAFWQYSSDLKVPNIILGCPVTFPPDKIYGKMLSGMGVPDILGTEGTFTFYTSEPISQEKETGGKVFPVRKAPLMVMHLIGPKVAGAGGKAENVKVPFKVTGSENQDYITIEYQNQRFDLKKGEWSDFKTVTFNLGLFKKARGILKFYLVENQPEFKLYLSPINFDPRKPFFPISYPSNYSKQLAEKLGLYYTLGMPMDTWAVNELRLGEPAFLQLVDEVLRENNEKLDLELNRFQKGILFCYFEITDIIQHMFWRYTDPLHPLYEKDAPPQYRETIKNYYQKMDQTLGKVMEKISPGDLLIVLSDHGFSTFRRAAHINTWLRKNGYLELKNPYAESGSELLKSIDWTRTKAYSIGFGAIYLNQVGREKNGIVKPGPESEALKQEISQKFKEWMDDKYQQPVIKQVYPREAIFWGQFQELAPDLYLGFNTGYRASWQTALGAVPKDLMEDNLKKWSGDHLIDPELIPGILFCNKPITKTNPSIYDIAPTILQVIGLNKEELQKLNLDGNPLF